MTNLFFVFCLKFGEEHPLLHVDERDLLLVTDYYFEDVATQFTCTDGTNSDLTWRMDLYSDPARASSLGCVTWGHDTSSDVASGCQEL